MHFQQKLKKLFCAVLAAIIAALMPLSAFAAESREELPEYRIAITPTQINLEEIKPGEVRTGKFTIKNTGKQNFKYLISFAPYAVEGQDYTPKYDRSSKYTDITDWITVDKKSGSLDSGEETELNYSINIPSDAHGGAQSAVIMATIDDQGDTDGTGVQTVRQVGYLVFGNVDGEIKQSGAILQNTIPGFLTKPPLTVSSLIQNTGNIYTTAETTVQIFPLFSDEEVFTNEDKPDRDVIFPETTYYNAFTWEDTPSIGLYRVKQTVTIFDQTSTEEELVVICPLWLIFVVLAILFLAIFWIVSRVRGRKDRR